MVVQFLNIQNSPVIEAISKGRHLFTAGSFFKINKLQENFKSFWWITEIVSQSWADVICYQIDKIIVALLMKIVKDKTMPRPDSKNNNKNNSFQRKPDTYMVWVKGKWQKYLFWMISHFIILTIYLGFTLKIIHS